MAPRSPFLDRMERVSRAGEARWRSPDRQRLYTWDSLHKEVEVFDKRGHHLGALDPETGVQIKDAVEGRSIDV